MDVRHSAPMARFLVIGAGIAGAGVAYELSKHASVTVLEREARPGYHTTGRSAALYSETYGNETIRALTTASRAFFESPPEGFAAQSLLSLAGTLIVGMKGAEERLDALTLTYQKLVPSVRRLSAAEVLARVPILKPDKIVGAVCEPYSMHMDVDAIHQGYLRGLKGRGGTIITGADVTRLVRVNELWEAHTPTGVFTAETVIDAAGAWADGVASLAGAKPLGLQPLRRTAAIVASPPGLQGRPCPMVLDLDEQFYFISEAGKIMVSLADETPSDPCDAYPEDYDVALAIDRIQDVADFPVERIERSWAGLRTFAPDRTPVVGYDAEVPGFFWLAGQGGYGIQTVPAVSEIAAALAMSAAFPEHILSFGIEEAALSPRRFVC